MGIYRILFETFTVLYLLVFILLRKNAVPKVPVFIIKILHNIPPVCIDFNVEETIPHSTPKIPLYRPITVSLYIALHS